jgi:hypothetical protein
MSTQYRLVTTLALWILAGLLLAAYVVLPALALAQAYTLRVALHAVDGHSVPGIVVIVRSEGGQELARQATSAEGAVAFVSLPAVVRVVVEGQPRGGPALFQLGDDAQGVRLDLAQAGDAPSLDLRVERDGLVLPDPATMITREEGGPVVSAASPIPTAALATPAPLPTAPAASGLPAVVVGEPVVARPSSPAWVSWVTVLIIAFATGVMLLIQRRRDAR